MRLNTLIYLLNKTTIINLSEIYYNRLSRIIKFFVTGIRTITNEDYGQRCISKGIVSYINNNGNLVTKDEYYEHLYLKDSHGKK